MKTIGSWAITLAVIAGISWWINPSIFAYLGMVENDDERIIDAWRDKTSNIFVEVEGRVVRLRPDLDYYTRFQHFLIELENGHRLMVKHDLDISQIVPVVANSMIRLKGEYDWSETGGVIHWTHRDITNTREGGWIDSNGIRYN
ncbi:MAG: hypothetical protein ACI9H8_001592 [Lysobacterales bacterium]|jgi:hypothetical protein